MTRNTVTSLLVGLCLIGLADSAYLTWDHGSHKADPMGFSGGLCGADGGCAVSRSSAFSELPVPGTPLDLPVSLLALSFYVVFLLLVAFDHRQRKVVAGEARTGSTTSRILLALASLATVYSMVLLGYSLSVGSVCKFCVVLYVVNAGLVLVAWRSLGESFAAFIAGAWRAAFSRPAAVAAVVMLSVTASGYLFYRMAVMSARASTEERMRAGTPGLQATADRPTKGPADAPVQIIEFADFECPHCRIAFKTLDELAHSRSDVSVRFLHFPLDQACNPLIDRPFHERACAFALLAECAYRQGRFWEVAAALFDAGEADKDTLLARIGDVAPGLDLKELERCASSDAAKAAVRADIELGITAKLRGTPAVFLNGVQIGGAVPRPELDKLIDELLTKKAP